MLRWSTATHHALYGPTGFYTTQQPAAHFRTSSQAAPFAAGIAAFVRRIDAQLGHPDPFTIVDVGAGDGGLLARITEQDDLNGRLRPVAVELRPRPEALGEPIEWRAAPPNQVAGVILACEWLDNVPCDVAVLDETGTVRYQLVAPATGETGLGPPITSADADWLAAWWPLTRPGDRAEIGRPRDLAWQGLLDRLTRGAALAIDYGHTRATRPALGSLTGYLAGRQVPAIPDGSRDITAHVAMDSLGDGMLRTQRDALRDLGIHGARPSLALAHHDPADYLRRLQTASVTAELTDPGGLGAHYWYTVLVD